MSPGDVNVLEYALEDFKPAPSISPLIPFNLSSYSLNMKIFKDVFCGDELFSDTYKMKLVDDCMWEVYGKVS